MEENLKQVIITYLPYLISIVTLWVMKITGDNNPKAWLFTILNQFLWLFWIWISGNNGFIILNIGIIAISLRNHFKWKKKITKA